MNASVLRDFFLGRASAHELQTDLIGTTEQTGHDSFRHHMTDLDDDFTVTRDHLVKLCDAVLAENLDPESLRMIGFGIIASDHFEWSSDSPEGEIVGNTIYDWSSPEVNFALNRATVAKFRHRLLTGENRFTRDDHFYGPETNKRKRREEPDDQRPNNG